MFAVTLSQILISSSCFIILEKVITLRYLIIQRIWQNKDGHCNLHAVVFNVLLLCTYKKLVILPLLLSHEFIAAPRNINTVFPMYLILLYFFFFNCFFKFYCKILMHETPYNSFHKTHENQEVGIKKLKMSTANQNYYL